MFSRTIRHHPTISKKLSYLSQFQSRNLHDIKVSLKFQCDDASKLSQRLKNFGAEVVGEAPIRRERVFYDRVPNSEVISTTGKFSSPDFKLSQNDIQERKELAKAEMTSDSSQKWYELSKSDSWLEKVDNKNWECRVPEKKPVTEESHLQVPRSRRLPKYRQLKGEKEIRRELNIQQDVTKPENIRSLEEDLEARGIRPYTKIVTKESVYELEGSEVSVIETDFGYSYAKLHRMCTNASIEDVKRAQDILANLGKDLRLTSVPYMNEDIEEFVRMYRPTLHQSLVDAGIAMKESSEEQV